jgi:hypothetical protein
MIRFPSFEFVFIQSGLSDETWCDYNQASEEKAKKSLDDDMDEDDEE